MRCEVIQEQLSASLDGELAGDDVAQMRSHVESCATCRRWEAVAGGVRRQLRFAPAGAAPDVAPAVLERIGAVRRPVRWTRFAAAFAAAVVAGAVFVGLRPVGDVAVADVPDLVLAAQHEVERLTATLRLTEHGWHRQVPVRQFTGTLRFAAPETLVVHLDDRTRYPSPAWVPNDVTVAVAPDVWWARGQAGCPATAQPDCAAPPRARVLQGREPFDPHGPAALDLVVPVRSFRHAAAPAPLGTRRIAGREGVGMSVTVAHVGPLLDGLRAAGDWRDLHPADAVALWLDRDAMVPLELVVTAAGGDERSLWAARHGYDDDAGDVLLHVSFSDIVVNGGVVEPPPAPPQEATGRDAGFRAGGESGVRPAWLADGMALYRAGTVTTAGGPQVAVAAWTDGRAWVKVRATEEWRGARLFGDVGDAVRPLDLGDAGVAYLGDDGEIAMHAGHVDVVVSGSVAAGSLRRVAASLGIVGQPVPPGWREADGADLAEAARRFDGLLVAPVDGFDSPAVRARGDGVDLTYIGAGFRSFVLSQSAGAELTPPLDGDVRGVAVRGTAGRYTPVLGELEWVEGDRVLSLRSRTLTLAELLHVAEGLRHP